MLSGVVRGAQVRFLNGMDFLDNFFSGVGFQTVSIRRSAQCLTSDNLGHTIRPSPHLQHSAHKKTFSWGLKIQSKPVLPKNKLKLFGDTMTTSTRTRTMLVLAAILATTFLAGTRQQAATIQGQAQAPDLTQQMPLDPQITIGKFPNGLRYYVRANKKPEGRAELRLVIKAGSILEDDDQQGLAHFVEHMAFNGTRNFPKHELISFIESLGMRFGADLNAYTSFDETVYMLQVPTDKPETMDRALLVLEDWAHNVTFDPAEIESERKVVMEEWRLGRGVGQRTQEKLFPILLKG